MKQRFDERNAFDEEEAFDEKDDLTEVPFAWFLHDNEESWDIEPELDALDGVPFMPETKLENLCHEIDPISAALMLAVAHEPVNIYLRGANDALNEIANMFAANDQLGAGDVMPGQPYWVYFAAFMGCLEALLLAQPDEDFILSDRARAIIERVARGRCMIPFEHRLTFFPKALQFLAANGVTADNITA